MKADHNLEQGIKELLDTWGDYVVLNLVDRDHRKQLTDSTKEVSRAQKSSYDYDKVLCTIVQPETPKEIEEAANAIVWAEQYAGELEQERNHEMNTPNWWKSLKLKIKYNKL